MSEFTYAAADAGCADYHDGNREATQTKFHGVCRQCFASYMQRVRERDAIRVRPKHAMTDAQKATKTAREKDVNKLYPERRVKTDAQKRGGEFKLTDSEAHKLLTAPQCTYCCRTATKMTIDRLVPDGAYAADNCVSACWDCNRAKYIWTLSDFVRICRSVHNFKYNNVRNEEPVDHFHSYDHKARGKYSLATSFDGYKYSAKRHNREFTINGHEFCVKVAQGCFYCGLSGTTHIVRIGIDRIDSDIGYTFANTVGACTSCNWAKKDLGIEQFFEITSCVANNSSL